MKDQDRGDTSNRTNNFHSWFERELIPPEELKGHLYYGVVGRHIAAIEKRGELWSRLKREEPELFQEILERIQRRRAVFDPDRNQWMELLRARQFDAAEKFDQEHRISERSKEIYAGLNPLLNKAFDLLVSWGAEPKHLLM